MARDLKLEVGAINLRIPEPENRDYRKLITALAGLRRGIQVHGDTYVAIRSFNEDDNTGVFVKYTEIDMGGDWFDLDKFEAADPETVGNIDIPRNLRPNHAEFYFSLDPDLHVIAFSTYADSRGLSVRAVDRYFDRVLATPSLQRAFGRVESDIVQSYGDAIRLLELRDIKEVSITVRRPNTDDIGDDLARIIEERLREQNGDEYQENIRVKGSGGIRPNERTKKLALVGAENGSVRVKAPVNGVVKWQDTTNQPLIEVTKYKPDESEKVTFLTLARRIFARVRQARRTVQDE